MSNTLLSLATERFSVRKYTNQPVSDDDLAYILECMRLAPSACNLQPWKFLVLRSAKAREKVCRCYDRPWLAMAPVVIVAFKNTALGWVRPDDGKPHGDVDVAIAVEHLCLAATERGLGTCWICNYQPDLLAQLFPQPAGWEAVAIIPVGHIAPDCPRKEKARKPLGEITEVL